MKKRIKRIIGISAGILFAAQAMTVYAGTEENMPETGLWEEYAPEGTEQVEDWYRPLLRYSLMYHGYIKLVDEDGKAGVYGETLALRDADEVGLELYLDRYTGTTYNSYTYWETVEYNTSMNIKSYTVSVPKGYYYRLHGYHYVSDGSDFENGETITQGLKIPQ